MPQSLGVCITSASDDRSAKAVHEQVQLHVIPEHGILVALDSSTRAAPVHEQLQLQVIPHSAAARFSVSADNPANDIAVSGSENRRSKKSVSSLARPIMLFSSTSEIITTSSTAFNDYLVPGNTADTWPSMSRRRSCSRVIVSRLSQASELPNCHCRIGGTCDPFNHQPNSIECRTNSGSFLTDRARGRYLQRRGLKHWQSGSRRWASTTRDARLMEIGPQLGSDELFDRMQSMSGPGRTIS